MSKRSSEEFQAFKNKHFPNYTVGDFGALMCMWRSELAGEPKTKVVCSLQKASKKPRKKKATTTIYYSNN